MRKGLLTLLSLTALLLAACGAASIAQPSTNLHTVTAVSAKVAAHYGEPHPQITHVTATLTDGASAVPMYLVALAGRLVVLGGL